MRTLKTKVASVTTYGERLEAALATQIKIELVERNMTQKDLAEAIGIGRPAMNHYMRGHRSIPMPTFFAVAEVLGISPRDLLERAEARAQRAG
jgi:transcriptional regulator with XRE-family HTH domain